MADISKDALRREITAILKDADLTTTSAKKVRQQIEEKLEVDLTERKKEVDDLVMECLEKKQESGKGKGKDSGKKRKPEDDDDDDDDEEEEEESEEEERSNKRSSAKSNKRAKKASSDDDSDDASDVRSNTQNKDNASDEEYSPTGGAKKAKGGKKGKGKAKKKGSDSDNDSDEDWNKSRRAAAPAKKAAAGAGGKRGGGGYTRAYTLSPELASVVGQDSMARHEVVRKIWSIIKERNLYDPKNKQFAICDDELLKVFGVKRFRTFGMMKYLKNHFLE